MPEEHLCGVQPRAEDANLVQLALGLFGYRAPRPIGVEQPENERWNEFIQHFALAVTGRLGHSIQGKGLDGHILLQLHERGVALLTRLPVRVADIEGENAVLYVELPELVGTQKIWIIVGELQAEACVFHHLPPLATRASDRRMNLLLLFGLGRFVPIAGFCIRIRLSGLARVAVYGKGLLVLGSDNVALVGFLVSGTCQA